MDAELSRLLSRVVNSPYFRLKGGDEAPTPEGGPVRDWLVAECEKAYTFNKLPANIQQALRLCDRSFEIAQEFNDQEIDRDTMDAKVVERVEQERQKGEI